MNIICDKSKLLEGINISLKAIPGKSTMAILECMVIEAKDGMIKLISNDLEIGIETIIEGDIKEPGSVAVNAKVFFEIIRKLPYNEVSITVNENFTMNISCGKAKFNIPVKDTEEFPYLPTVIKDKSVLISQFTLKEVIRQTVFSISDNENTKVMTGELFEIQGSQLKVVSLDGHRISIRKIELKQSYDDVSVIIPGKTLIEISKILNGGLDDEICMYFTDKHVLFEFDNTIVLSRLIEGDYSECLWIADGICEDRGASRACRGVLAESGEICAVEDIVAEDECHWPVPYELPSDEESLCDSVGGGLCRV